MKQTQNEIKNGKFVKTPIGILHADLMAAGLLDALFVEYRPHLKVLLKTLGRQPDNIQNNGRDLICISRNSVLTVQLCEHPF